MSVLANSDRFRVREIQVSANPNKLYGVEHVHIVNFQVMHLVITSSTLVIMMISSSDGVIGRLFHRKLFQKNDVFNSNTFPFVSTRRRESPGPESHHDHHGAGIDHKMHNLKIDDVYMFHFIID